MIMAGKLVNLSSMYTRTIHLLPCSSGKMHSQGYEYLPSCKVILSFSTLVHVMHRRLVTEQGVLKRRLAWRMS